MIGTIYSRTVSGKDGKKDFKVYNIKLTGKDGVPRFFNARFSKAVPDNGGTPLQVEIDANNVNVKITVNNNEIILFILNTFLMTNSLILHLYYKYIWREFDYRLRCNIYPSSKMAVYIRF